MTAYNMLSEFVDLQPGDWVVQNGGNSAVRCAQADNDHGDSIDIGGASCNRAGQVAQIEYDQLHPEKVGSVSSFACAFSDPSFRRTNFSDTEQYLKNLGANHVVTYDELEDKSFLERVKEWTGGKAGVDFACGITH